MRDTKQDNSIYSDQLDGMAISDLIAMIGNHSGYYLSKWRDLVNYRSKISWNWAAFFAFWGWAIYRKMYRVFGALLAIHLLFVVVYYGWIGLSIRPDIKELRQIQMDQQITATDEMFIYYGADDEEISEKKEAVEAISEKKSAIKRKLIAGSSVFLIASLLLNIVLGMFANYLYFLRCKKRYPMREWESAFYKPHQIGAAIAVSPVIGIISSLIENWLIPLILKV